MKIFKRIMMFLLLVFVGIQFVPTELNTSNAILETDFTNTFVVPEQIQNILEVSCYDCHSNNTKYPWYNKVQPIRWILGNHIEEGKEELNFSEFGSYSKRRMKSKLKSIISQIDDDEMPISSYTIIHKDAKLTDIEKKQVLEWFNSKLDSL